ncbi:MAG: sulfite exporter TauE/SafE family protein [Rhodospirillales bacterium]|nr:sulfite exporter TauE/SafE family protein [Rhodospirillales bacterium]
MEQAAFQLAGVDAATFAYVGFAAFAASIVGGVSGYGVGLILPVVIAPVVGVAGVIPAMAVSMAITNFSRVVAFWRDIDWPRAKLALAGAVPCCVLSAYVYTLLPTTAIAAVLGVCLVGSVPLRRALASAGWRVSDGGIVAGGAAYGILIGGMTGLGAIVIATFMAAGVEGAALIGTDALVSLFTNLVKVAVFGTRTSLDADLAVAGLLMGACTIPGAFVGRWLLDRFAMSVHTALMDALVLFGGASFLWRAWTGAA